MKKEKNSEEQQPKTKKSFYKRWWFIAIVVVVVIIVISSVMSGGGNSNKTASSSSAASSSKAAATAKVINFSDIVKAYASNGPAADDVYKGKLLEFSGKVTNITAGVLGGSDVTIEAGSFVADNDLETTSAVVHFSNTNDVKSLVTGQTYTFQAKGNGATVLDGGWVSTLEFSNGSIK